MTKTSAVRSIFRRCRLLAAAPTLLALSMAPAVSSAQNNAQLRHVPDDTIFFVGNLKPVSINEWMDFFPGMTNGGMRNLLDEMVEDQQKQSTGTAADEIVNSDAYTSFMRAYADFWENPEENLLNYGIDADAFSMAFYMSGVSPVLRIKLTDPDQFIAAVEEQEKTNGFEPLIQPLSGTEVRLYEIDSELANAPRVAVTVVGDDAVIALSFNDEDLLRTIGLDSITGNLARADTLPNLQKDYGYTSDMVGFLDIEKLVLTLTDAQSSGGKSLMDSMGDKDETAALRTPECQTEMQQMASIWPRVVFGYQEYDVGSENLAADGHMAIEINHPGITDALSKLRGHIPENIRSADSVFSFAMGVDVSRLGQAVGELAMLMSEFNYQCSSLTAFNAITPQTMQQGVMGVNMLSGMAQGVRGFSMSLFDVDVEMLDSGSPKVNKFDAMINIPAQNPQMLLNMAKAIPQLSGFTVPEDGTPVEIGQDLAAQAGQELDVDVNVAQRGKQIVMFSGAESTALAEDSSAAIDEDNGFMNFSMNFARVADLAKRMGELMPGEEDEEDFSKQMESITAMYPDGQYTYAVDFTERGIEINTRFDVTKPQ